MCFCGTQILVNFFLEICDEFKAVIVCSFVVLPKNNIYGNPGSPEDCDNLPHSKRVRKMLFETSEKTEFTAILSHFVEPTKTAIMLAFVQILKIFEKFFTLGTSVKVVGTNFLERKFESNDKEVLHSFGV